MAAKKDDVQWLRHTNQQTFGVSAATAIYETISTPGVDIRNKVACLIGMIRVLVGDIGAAAGTHITQWRTQLLGGTHTALVTDPTDQKFVCEKLVYSPWGGVGPGSIYNFPLTIDGDGLQPMYVVNPKLTILHAATNAADMNQKTVTTMIDYVNVELDGDEYQAMMMAQMDIS